MENNKVCCFIGHRKISLTVDLKKKVKCIIEDLIINHNVYVFLFGSRSEFNDLCHSIVTNLKEVYKNIKRIAYSCKSESIILESERKDWERIYSNFFKKTVRLLGVEEEFEHKNKYTSGRASYVERNQAMIDNSDYCVFYYDEVYEPQIQKYSKKSCGFYQPKSGTKLAYNYAKQKKKIIINVNSV